MRSSQLLLLGAYAPFLSAAAVISQRSVSQGRSLQSGTDGAPKCADPSLSLWQDPQGNNFCCEVGLVGVYESSGDAVGTCVASDQAGTATPARLISTGTGSTVTTEPTVKIAGRSTIPKAVFAHYMVGSMTSDEAVKDVKDAIDAGFDGFALNTHSISTSDKWNTDALDYLFAAAEGTDFKLFLSFDMSWKLDVTKMAAFLAPYAKKDAHYKVDGKAFVSTYTGGTVSNSDWSSGFIEPLKSDHGITPFFVPNFDDFSGYPTGVFSEYPILDGVFSWESAWPAPGNTPANVSDEVDSAALEEAHSAGKTYMMPLSSFQFKYLGSGQNWYRMGEVNLPERMGQALKLQPDFVEVITWNDAGESHNVGNFWPEQIAGSKIGDYNNGFDHKGWLQIITPFIKAYKEGATSLSEISPPSDKPVGSLWYRTLLTSASCSSSISNHESARDTMNFAVILPSDGYKIKVYSNDKLIGSFDGQKGLNYNSILGLAAGSGQRIEVVDNSDQVVTSAKGTKSVSAETSDETCNWNYEVVGLS